MQIEQAIENLYEAFSHYPLRPVIEGCTCGCIKENDHKKLHSKPLRELMPDQLMRFAFKALTTWGDVPDLKHFLPRIFELLIFDRGWVVDGWVISSRLNRAEWQSWPKSERTAVENIFPAWWDYVLSTEPELFRAEECLCSIATAVGDISPYLETWKQSDAIPALQHLACFVILSANPLYQDKDKSLFIWPPGTRQQMVDWLFNMRIVDKLETGFLNQVPDTDIALAADILRELIDYNKTPTSGNNA